MCPTPRGLVINLKIFGHQSNYLCVGGDRILTSHNYLFLPAEIIYIRGNTSLQQTKQLPARLLPPTRKTECRTKVPVCQDIVQVPYQLHLWSDSSVGELLPFSTWTNKILELLLSLRLVSTGYKYPSCDLNTLQSCSLFLFSEVWQRSPLAESPWCWAPTPSTPPIQFIIPTKY